MTLSERIAQHRGADHAHAWHPAPWLTVERADGSLARYDACECGANRTAVPAWVQRMARNTYVRPGGR